MFGDQAALTADPQAVIVVAARSSTLQAGAPGRLVRRHQGVRLYERQGAQGGLYHHHRGKRPTTTLAPIPHTADHSTHRCHRLCRDGGGADGHGGLHGRQTAEGQYGAGAKVQLLIEVARKPASAAVAAATTAAAIAAAAAPAGFESAAVFETIRTWLPILRDQGSARAHGQR